jgi:signal transduction histidine kinase
MSGLGQQALQRQIDQLERENARLRDQADSDSHSRLMAEEELGKTEDRLQLALDAAGLAMWEWDLASHVVYTSRRFAELVNDFGNLTGEGQAWSPEDLAQKVSADDRAPLRQAVVDVLKQKESRLEVECRIRTSDGIRWLEATGEVTQRDMLGYAQRLVGVVRDVTRRREIHQEIELARAQAVAANSAKDDFLAHISHEIRTPLNGVIGMNNLLAQTALAPEQRQYVELVGSSGRALLALVNDVLDYSRLEAHKLILEQVRFPLKRWLWEVVTPLRVSAEAKGLELIVSASDHLPTEGVGDPGRLRQIVTNLVSNAIKFTQKGHIDVSMRPSDEFEGQLGLLLSVKDTGIGIALLYRLTAPPRGVTAAPGWACRSA